MCAHNATHNSRTSTRHCHALDLRHFAGARSVWRAFLVEYSSSTRRTRRVVLPAVYCINVESSVRIDFPMPSRVGRMATSQATIECLHSHLLGSRRTSQSTRAHDAPYSCEYNARVAEQHTQLRYESAGEHTIAISIDTRDTLEQTPLAVTNTHKTLQRHVCTQCHAPFEHQHTPLPRTRLTSLCWRAITVDARFSLNTRLPLVAHVALCCQQCTACT